MSSKTTFSKFNQKAQPPADPGDIPAEAEALPPQPQASRALSLFGKQNAASALLAVTEQSDGGAKSPFPVIQVTGGPTGGLFAAVKGTADQDILDQLPQGNKPIKGFFLAYRTTLVAWPEGWKGEDEKTEGENEKSRPCWTAVIPAGAVADAQLAYKACEAYQFTPGDDKAKFDFAGSDVGHVRPQLQMLVFLPDIEDVAVVQAPAYFTSWVETQKTLRLLVNPETKQLDQFPCCIRVVTKDAKSKKSGRVWKNHHCDVTQAVDAVTKKAWDLYQPWVAKLQEDAERMALFQTWLDGSDEPVTDEIRARLRKASVI